MSDVGAQKKSEPRARAGGTGAPPDDDGDEAGRKGAPQSLSEEIANEVANEILNSDPEAVGNLPLGQIYAKFPRVKLLVVAEQVRALAAGRWFFNRGTKEWMEMVDGSTRQRASDSIRDTIQGKPPITTLNLNLGGKGGPKEDSVLEEQLARSPALRGSFRRQLDEADRLAAMAATAVQKTGSEKPPALER